MTMSSSLSSGMAVARAAALCLITAACSVAPAPAPQSDPADPAASTPAASYRPVLGGYVSRRPVEPAPWRERNERVAPSPQQ
jgi:hypothetical protein